MSSQISASEPNPAPALSKQMPNNLRYGSIEPPASSEASYRKQTRENSAREGGDERAAASAENQPPKPAVRQRSQKSAPREATLEPSESDRHLESLKSKYEAVQQELVEFNRNSKSRRISNQDSPSEEAPNMVKDAADKAAEQKNSASLAPQLHLNPLKAPALNEMSILTAPKVSGDAKVERHEAKLVKRPYPKKVLFIVANEFCERFSYYGLRAVLVLYFRSVLGFSDTNSTVSFHLFVTLCYLTPILGAILGDTVLGKFKTIFYMSMVYLLGEVILVLSSFFWSYGIFSVCLTFSGLFMIGLGTGGIKPCVSTFGGDQFLEHEQRWRESFFSLFYAAINLGSTISMFATPMLRSNFQCVNRADCFPYAFGLPCLLMFVAIVVFLVAKNQYNCVALPERNVIVAFCQCVWLALRRKFTSSCPQGSVSSRRKHSTDSQGAQHLNSVSTSNSSLAMDTNEIFHKVGAFSRKEQLDSVSNFQSETALTGERKHWLYLASDRFDSSSIEDFRCVLALLLLYLPGSVYWCLYDLQGSLWTLQASRMDGQLSLINFTLEPDQMSVANPLILLALIPVFELFIYPLCSRFKLVRRPIQRMTTGLAVAALTFVVTALIETHIQRFQPANEPLAGQAHLLLVNGLTECSVTNPMISALLTVDANSPPLSQPEQSNSQTTSTPANNSATASHNSTRLDIKLLESFAPLETKALTLRSSNASSAAPQIGYQLKFNLLTNNSFVGSSGCPFSSQFEHEFQLGTVQEKSTKLLYLEQGNGKLTFKVFNDSLVLPEPGKARVRLLYESFGSLSQAEKRQFFLVGQPLGSANSTQQASAGGLYFPPAVKDGQVFLSDYIDVNVPTKGASFFVRSNDNLISDSKQTTPIKLKPGTRNLIIVHQKDATNVLVKHEVLQDNSYRISMLYQLVPYLMISISEIMYNLTALEFSYSMAPESMKSLIMAALLLSTALGNMLTVVVESLHLFSNVVNDFYFYAVLMVFATVIFAILGYRFKPRSKSEIASQ